MTYGAKLSHQHLEGEKFGDFGVKIREKISLIFFQVRLKRVNRNFTVFLIYKRITKVKDRN